MDDLAGLSWPEAQRQPGTARAGAPNYSPLLPSMGANGTASPAMQSRSGSAQVKAKDDPFGELVSFSSSPSSSAQQSQSKLSLRERQQQLREEQSRSTSPFSFQQSPAPGAASSSASMFPGGAAKGAWDFDALAGVGAPPKPPRQQAAAAANIDTMSFDPLAKAPLAPAPEPVSSSSSSNSSDDEPIPMDIHVKVEAKSEPFADLDFEIAQVAEYGFSVEQARAALEITGSPRAAVQLLREQKVAARQATDRRAAAADRGHGGQPAGGQSRLRTPYREEPIHGRGSSSDDNDGAGGQHRNGNRQGNGGADSLIASANELGASVWKQANSWFEIGKKKLMEVHDQHWSDARTGGSWTRPGQQTQYTGTSQQRYGGYDTSSDDDDDGRYVAANRHGRQPERPVEPMARASPRLHAEPTIARGSGSRTTAAAADLLGGMSDNGLSIAREAPPPRPARPQDLRPQQAQQAQQAQPTQQAKAAIPAVPEHVLGACNAAKADANEKFKLGQFGDAIVGYTQAVAQVGRHSAQHPLLILLLNNRALAYARNGEAKMALADCSQTLQLCAVYQANGTIDLGAGGQVSVADQRAKALQRRAEANEAGERYQDALADWQALRGAARDSNGRQQAVRGVQRCEKALGIGQPAQKPVAAAVPATADDLANVFASISMASIKGGGTNILNQQTESSAAVAEMRRKERVRQAEDDQRLAMSDQVDAELARWKAGKQQNLRALLASIHTVLPAFPPIGMHEVLEASKVKRAYMRTIARLHPDKVDRAADVRTRMVSASVFSSLNEAWDAFKTQEGTG